jgi:hypothetical protein
MRRDDLEKKEGGEMIFGDEYYWDKNGKEMNSEFAGQPTETKNKLQVGTSKHILRWRSAFSHVRSVSPVRNSRSSILHENDQTFNP